MGRHVAWGDLVVCHRAGPAPSALRHAVRNGEVQRLGAVVEPLAVLGQLEDLTPVGPFPFEDRARVVQGMAQYMQARLAPGHELAVVPNEPIAVMVGDQVGHALSPPGSKPGLNGVPCETCSPAPYLTPIGKLPNLRAT